MTAIHTGASPASFPDVRLGGPRRRGWPTVLAWLVIAGIAGFIIVRQARRAAEGDLRASLVMMQAQARLYVGGVSLHLPGFTTDKLYSEIKPHFDRGSYSHRLRFAVLAGELIGPDEALKELARLEDERRDGDLEAREVSVEAAGKLERLYAGYRKHPGPPALSPEDQEWLRSRMGWFGELALAPANGDPAARAAAMAPAHRAVIAFFALILFGMLGLSAGGFLLLLFVFSAGLGRLSGALTCGTGRGGVYAETFALYMVLYVGLGYVARMLSVPGWVGMGLSAAVAFLSLASLAWPRLRGVAWRQVRDDLGLHLGQQPLAEVLCGPATYLCAMPLLAAGMAVMYALMYAQKQLGLGDPTEPGAGPSHPIIGVALSGDVWMWLQVFLAACVAAPVVEEIMFRGVLYRHLREASCRWGRVPSVLASILASSFVFAAIHPQGWLGVPVLMALATAFALAREWRQSLVACVIAHGINNGVSLLLLLMVAA